MRPGKAATARKASLAMQLDYFADHLDLAPLLAAWHHREWADLLAGNRGAVQHGFPGGFLQTGSPDRPARSRR